MSNNLLYVMNCPTCGAKAPAGHSHVRNGLLQRYRECENGHSFITIEIPKEAHTTLASITKDLKKAQEAVNIGVRKLRKLTNDKEILG